MTFVILKLTLRVRLCSVFLLSDIHNRSYENVHTAIQLLRVFRLTYDRLEQEKHCLQFDIKTVQFND